MTFKLAPFDGRDFDGAKIAILRGHDVLSLQRDDIPSIPFPGEWDLPGGGREGAETPFETAARELFEELSVPIGPERLIYQAEEDSFRAPGHRVHFFVARWDDLSDSVIKLGDEGQGWAWIPARDYVTRSDTIEIMRGRLSRALEVLGL